MEKPEIEIEQTEESRGPVLFSDSFKASANKYGVSYALLQKEIEAKKRVTGKALSASQYARAERKIRSLVNAGTGAISSQEIGEIANKLKESNGFYFDYDTTAEGSLSFAREITPQEWVRHAKRGEMPAPDPAVKEESPQTEKPAKRVSFGFKFFN